MATLAKGQTFGATEQVTNTKLHALVDSGTVSSIVNADIASGANISDDKINIDGTTLVGIAGTQTITGNKTFSGTTSFAGGTISNLGTVTTGTITNCTMTNDPTFSSGSALFPSGGIIIWSGAVSAIPSGWVICDGNNGTPNLTDRFVLHADADAAGTNNVGDTGGVSAVTLTSAQSGLPAHTHNVPGKQNGTISTAANFPRADTAPSDGNLATLSNTAADAASSHTNRDKYYALAYIMKT